MKHFLEEYGETIFFLLLALTIVAVYRALVNLSLV